MCSLTCLCPGDIEIVVDAWDLVKCLLSWNTLQGGLDACVIGQDTGKENVDPTPVPKHPRMPRAKKVSTVIVPGYVGVLVQFALGFQQQGPDTDNWLCFVLCVRL